MSASQLSVGIIGGGIGGLTAANALVRQGCRVRVYEQAARYIPWAGAGFGFSPNGQVCLASIGIDVRPMIHSFDRMIHLDRNGTAKLESDFFAQLRERYGFGLGGCLRADLVETLSKRLTEKDDQCLQWSHKLVSMEQDDKSVRLSFEGRENEVVEHDIVIGADGIHSKVAELLEIDHSPPIYSDANIFYGVIDNPDQTEFNDKVITQDHTIVQGNVTGEFITFRAGPNEKKVQVWANTYVSSTPPPREEWEVADAKSPELASVLDQFPSTHPIHELAAHTTPGRLLHFGLFYRKHKDIWSNGRTCLLGDSCHATLPYVGQGANLAIEDAIVLADCLSQYSNDYKEAFQSYFEQRSRRTRRVVRVANWLDKLHHAQNPIVTMAREFLLVAFFKGNLVSKAIEKEIVEECPIPTEDFAKYR